MAFQYERYDNDIEVDEDNLSTDSDDTNPSNAVVTHGAPLTARDRRRLYFQEKWPHRVGILHVMFGFFTLILGGTLQALEQLDRRNNFASQKEGQARIEEMALLRKQIRRLRERKEELLGKKRKQKILCDTLLEQTLPEKKTQEDIPKNERILEKECELKKLQALAAVHRLTGLSCEPIKGDRRSNLLLKWDPSFRGNFFETFYAQVEMVPECRVVHHSLPLFVPIEELEKSLKGSVTEFGMKVRQHLQAFVARRHITLQLKESIPPHYLEAEVHTTAAANCIQLELCNLTEPLSSIVVLLIFDDLRSFHVSRVVVKKRGPTEARGLDEIEDLRERLMTEDIVDCMKDFLSREMSMSLSSSAE